MLGTARELNAEAVADGRLELVEAERLASEAGFDRAEVTNPDLEPHARAAGIPEEELVRYRGRFGGQLLVAT
jgi:hypothetical protein